MVIDICYSFDSIRQHFYDTNGYLMKLNKLDFSTIYFSLLIFLGSTFCVYLGIRSISDWKSHSYVTNNYLKAQSISGEVEFRRVGNNEYWVNLKNNDKVISFRCHYSARMSDWGECSIDNEIAKKLNQQYVTVHYLQMPKMFWYENPYPDVIKITANAETFYQYPSEDWLKSVSEHIEFRNLSYIFLIGLIAVTNIVFVYAMVYIWKYG